MQTKHMPGTKSLRGILKDSGVDEDDYQKHLEEKHMESTQEILHTLASVKSELRAAFKVQEIGVFGSVIRGEQKESSDIDVLVGLDGDADLLDLIALSQFLEERLHHKVDIVPRNALRPEIREQVLREVRYL